MTGTCLVSGRAKENEIEMNTSDLTIVSKIFTNESKPVTFIEELNSTVQELDIFLSTSKIDSKKHQRLALNYVTNTDGTVRWMFPSSYKKPFFLRLYTPSSLRAKILKAAMSVCYRLGFKGVFSKKVYLYSQQELIPVGLANEDKYALFFGTRGKERKVVIAIAKKNKVKSFMKVPIGEKAKSLVNNEYRMLTRVNALTLANCTVPKVAKEGGRVTVSNIHKPMSKAVQSIDKRHVRFLTALYQDTLFSELLFGQQFLAKIENRVAKLSEERDTIGSHLLTPLLREVLESIDQYQFVPLAYMHGDFTPWNTMVTPTGIQVYDWERSQEKMPVFYDLVHYVVQAGILVKKSQPKEIIDAVENLFARKDVKAFASVHNISFDLLLKLYLVDQFSYLLAHYQTQKDELHPQSYWMCEAAKGLLEWVHEPTVSYRKVFIHQFFDAIKSYEYALMKFTEGELDKIAESSDLDICVSKKVAKALIGKIEQNARVLKTKLTSKSYMSTLRVYFKDNSFISIDFIYRFERKSVQLLSNKEVLKNIGVTKEGVKVPQPSIDFEYKLLFYQLNGSAFPQKYKGYYLSLPEGKQKSVLNYINDKYGLEGNALTYFMDYSSTLKAILQQRVLKNKLNTPVKKVLRGVRYLSDTFRQLLTNKGIIITVSGVDGAGKSTFINGLKSELSEKFRHKVVVLRHRPSILPILSVYKYGKEKAHERATAMMPRTGGNKNKLTSLLRFGYYYLDYLFGQFYIHLRYVRRGYLVIFDRYYFDFISDPKRSNLAISPLLPKTLYRFVMNPDINVLLYADPLMILQRKKELSREDIVELTQSYLNLFKDYSNRYNSSKFVAIENIDLAKSLSRTIQEYIKAS